MIKEEEKINFIKENQNLIYKIALKYSKYYPLEDLFQVGVIGVIKALDNYQDNNKSKFSTYAYKYILGEIIKFINNDRNIKVSPDTLSLYKSYEKTKDFLTTKLGKIPTFNEISAFMEINPQVLSDAIEKCEFTVSLDNELTEDFSLETVTGTDNREEIDNLLDLKRELEKLSEIDSKIIELRYFKGYTQSETAEYLETNQVLVSRYESRILKKMKKNIAA